MEILNAIKIAWKLYRETDKLPEYKQIIDSTRRLSEVESENAELKKEIRRLKEKLETKEDLDFRNDAYWKKDGSVAFCANCYGAKDRLIPMQNWGQGRSRCNTCNSVYRTDPVLAQRSDAQQMAINSRKRGSQFI